MSELENQPNVKLIFHIPWKSSENQSASEIRPRQMLNTFKSLGFDVVEISGTNRERLCIIKQIKRDIARGVHYHYCYSESSTQPTLLASGKTGILSCFAADYRFFHFLKNKGIPLGLFLRDIYWRFDDFKRMYIKKYNILKYLIFVFAYWCDIIAYMMFVTVLYIPSMRMKKYLPGILQNKKTIALPSGLYRNNEIIKEIKSPLKYIYVGGIGRDHYNMEVLFQSISDFYGAEFCFSFRKDEWEDEKKNYDKYLSKNIHIVHYQNKELVKLYTTCHIGLLFCEPTIYRSFAMPFKLFEYLSYEKPVITVEGTAAGDFVKENDVGWAIPCDKDMLMELFRHLSENTNEVIEKQKKIALVINDNLWTSRALSVHNNLNV